MTDVSKPPSKARSLKEFGAGLRIALGNRALDTLAADLETLHRADREALGAKRVRVEMALTAGRTKISDVLAGRKPPDDNLLLSLLRLVDDNVDDAAVDSWRVVRDRIVAGAVHSRARDGDPHLLGVGRAVDVVGAGDAMPAYVRRDADIVLHARLNEAAKRGGFVLVIGEGSAGCTRSAYEAMRTLMPGWRIVHPPAERAALAGLTGELAEQTVVWVDRLERYLQRGLDSDTVRAWLLAPLPVVVLGTMSSTDYTTAVAPAVDADDATRAWREVLALARPVIVATAWSDAEIERADAVAVDDPLVKEALRLSDANVSPPRVLAAVPELEKRWNTAAGFTAGFLAAALDATRLGRRSPLDPEALGSAVAGYCDASTRARAPDDWRERALAYATTPLQGTVAALEPVAGPGMGEVAGYVVAPYLNEYAGARRRRQPVPRALWDVLVQLPGTQEDQERLRVQAARRALLGVERRLLDAQLDEGGAASHRAAAVLRRRGSVWAVEMLRAKGGANADAGEQLAALLGRRAALGDEQAFTELRERAVDSHAAAVRLTAALAERGDGDALADLQAQAASSPLAVRRLAAYWRRRARRDDAALARLRALARAEPHADHRLGVVLGQRAVDDPEALAELRDRAGAVSDVSGEATREAAERFAVALADRARRRDDAAALTELCARAQAGDGHAGDRAAAALASRDGRAARDQLAALASTDTPAVANPAAARLLSLRVADGDGDAASELRERAASDTHAATRLADLLADLGDQDDIAELRSLADSHASAAAPLVRLLVRCSADLPVDLRQEVHAGNSHHATDALLTAYAGGDAERRRTLAVHGLDADAEPAE